MSTQTATTTMMHDMSSTETGPRTSPLQESVGRLLKRSREEKNLSLDEASRATKIKKEFLLAIEEEKFENLPGPVFARGFIRSYAEYLMLEPQPLLEKVNRIIDGSEMPEIPGGTPKARGISWAVYTAGFVTVAAAVAFLMTNGG